MLDYYKRNIWVGFLFLIAGSLNMFGREIVRLQYDSQIDSIVSPPVIIDVKQSGVSLEESIVVAEVSGKECDSVCFSYNAIATGREKVLGELLSNIPGIKLLESGWIIYEGRYVNKIFIDGLDLMGTDYSSAVFDLDASLISYIEISYNQRYVKISDGFPDAELCSINVILKDDAKRAWLYSGEHSIGTDNGMLLNTRNILSKFGTESQNMLSVKVNNIGDRYDTKSGEYREIAPSNGLFGENVSYVISFNKLNREGKNDTFRYSINAGADICGNEYKIEKNYYLGNSNALNLIENNNESNGDIRFSGETEYMLNKENRFISNKSSINFRMDILGSDITGDKNVIQKNVSRLFNAENIFDGRVELGRKKALGFRNETKYTNTLDAADYDYGASSLVQALDVEEFSNQSRLSYVHDVSGWKLSASTGLSVLYNGAEAGILRGFSEPSDEESLRVQQVNPDVRFSLFFHQKKTSVYFAVPVRVNFLSINGADEYVYPSCHPVLQSSYKLSKKTDINASLSYNLARSEITTLLRTKRMQDYRTYMKADSLSAHKYFDASVKARYSDRPSGFFGTLSLYYRSDSNEKTPASEHTLDNSYYYYVDMPSESRFFGVSGKADKYFGHNLLLLTAELSLSNRNSEEYLQSKLIQARSGLFLSTISAKYHPEDWLSCFVKVRAKQESYKGVRPIEARSIIVEGKTSVRLFPRLELNVGLLCSKASVLDKNYLNPLLVDAELSRTFRNITLYVRGQNLMDIDYYKTIASSPYQIINKTAALRNRAFLIGIRIPR